MSNYNMNKDNKNHCVNNQNLNQPKKLMEKEYYNSNSNAFPSKQVQLNNLSGERVVSKVNIFHECNHDDHVMPVIG